MIHYYTTPTSDLLAELVYELSDANEDSARLAMELVEAECWQTDACRPGDLRRAGREALAILREEQKSGDSSPAAGARRRRLSLGRRPRTQPVVRTIELLPIRSAT
jgi:hypothetical protein